MIIIDQKVSMLDRVIRGRNGTVYRSSVLGRTDLNVTLNESGHACWCSAGN